MSHLLVCLPTLELYSSNRSPQQKTGHANALSLGTNTCKERNVATLKRTHQAKKQCNFNSG